LKLTKLVLLSLLLPLAFAVTPPSVHATLNISSSRKLTSDVNGPIVITADNVVLDCAGHKVTGTGSGTGIFLSSRTAVTVKNCVVTNFDLGIALDFSSGNTLTGNKANKNVNFGFALEASNDNTLTKNTANNNVNFDGFLLYSSSSGNSLSGNSQQERPQWLLPCRLQ
jgi:parallel beta-helix repeat protein